jgi:hypothetical protein
MDKVAVRGSQRGWDQIVISDRVLDGAAHPGVVAVLPCEHPDRAVPPAIAYRPGDMLVCSRCGRLYAYQIVEVTSIGPAGPFLQVGSWVRAPQWAVHRRHPIDSRLGDPACPPSVLEAAAAGDDRRVRMLVARHPACPPRLLGRLLSDGDLEVAQAAAHNPVLPTQALAMWRSAGDAQ